MWASIRILHARFVYDEAPDSIDMTFGQVLPVFLLVSPVATMIINLFPFAFGNSDIQRGPSTTCESR